MVKNAHCHLFQLKDNVFTNNSGGVILKMNVKDCQQCDIQRNSFVNNTRFKEQELNVIQFSGKTFDGRFHDNVLNNPGATYEIYAELKFNEKSLLCDRNMWGTSLYHDIMDR